MRRPVRLNCETLEGRLTPAVAYALNAPAVGAANLLAFDTATPTAITTTVVNGINASERVAGIDFRPQNGQLYALGVNDALNTATLYSVSTRTGVATIVSPTGTAGQIALRDRLNNPVDLPDPTGTGYGFDFNPAVDRIRVVAGTLNFRIDPNTGLAIDGDYNGAAGGFAGTNPDADLNGAVINLDASAYANNNANVTSTTLYGLDALSNALYTQAANSGTTTAVGAPGTTLGFDFTLANGFDITASGAAFAALSVDGVVGLYRVNLTTTSAGAAGTAAFIGFVGNGTTPVQGFAMQSDAPGSPAVAIDESGRSIVRFNTANPAAATTAAFPRSADPSVMGDVGEPGALAFNDRIVGLDYRPNTGQLFALAVDTTVGSANFNTLQLYQISPENVTTVTVDNMPVRVDMASAAPVGGRIPASAVGGGTLPAGGYGFDFNPAAAAGNSRIRVTTDTGGRNFRLNPNDGSVVMNDGAINGSGSTGVAAAAYTNSFGQGTTGTVTTLYTLDSTLNRLFIQSPPDAGTQSMGVPITLDGEPLDFSEVSGFDIPGGVRAGTSNGPATGFGFAALSVNGITGIYSIDLATGVATSLGTVGTPPAGTLPISVGGLTVADSTGGVVAFESATITGVEGTDGADMIPGIDVVLVRTGGTGPQTVTINVVTAGSTTTPNDDYPAGPFTVTFADGATRAVLNIPFVDDNIAESSETLNLSIGAVSNGLIGTQSTTTITVSDPPPMVPPAPPAPPPPAPPAPPPAIIEARVIGNLLFVRGPNGTVAFAVPPGTFAGVIDINGDGALELIVLGPAGAVAVDAQSGRFLLVALDFNGDGVRDVRIFTPSGNSATTDGRTGAITIP